ncbi:MAG: UDP-2,3-diacylglucosamine diphosphatase LpxI [Bdellovibrionales bacterium]|nr:UDP-2,3-diacylglucosamine diphosphatase LpxI [Bdellovibrionales bacterium]
MISRIRQYFSSSAGTARRLEAGPLGSVGIIAGNGPFPIRFAREAKAAGHTVLAVCHEGETDPAIENEVDRVVWVKVGELGRLISAFKDAGVKRIAMAGGIGRVNRFGDIKLDARGARLMLKLRTTKDDVVMRGIASELEREGIVVEPCTLFLKDCLVPEGALTRRTPNEAQWSDIHAGAAALHAMSAHDIGQLVVVKQGVIVAVEAVEGSDAAIRRGGELGGADTVVVKIPKPTQDMRFDVPTIGKRTIETMQAVGARVLAVEAGSTLMMDGPAVVELAEREGIIIVGFKSA